MVARRRRVVKYFSKTMKKRRRGRAVLAYLRVTNYELRITNYDVDAGAPMARAMQCVALVVGKNHRRVLRGKRLELRHAVLQALLPSSIVHELNYELRFGKFTRRWRGESSQNYAMPSFRLWFRRP